MYNVYLAYEGCGLEFVGRAKDINEAQQWADEERDSVSLEWEWHSHRAAGATEFYPARQRGEPDNPVSDDEVIWLDSELPYMAVEAVI